MDSEHGLLTLQSDSDKRCHPEMTFFADQILGEARLFPLLSLGGTGPVGSLDIGRGLHALPLLGILCLGLLRVFREALGMGLGTVTGN